MTELEKQNIRLEAFYEIADFLDSEANTMEAPSPETSEETNLRTMAVGESLRLYAAVIREFDRHKLGLN